MDRFNPNEEIAERDYPLEITLTHTEMQDLVDFAEGKPVDIQYVILNILEEIQPELYGVKRRDTQMEKVLQQRVVCCHCNKPLADNQLVKDAYKMNTVNGWAKMQLNILADMAEDREMQWFADEVRKIAGELLQL